MISRCYCLRAYQEGVGGRQVYIFGMSVGLGWAGLTSKSFCSRGDSSVKCLCHITLPILILGNVELWSILQSLKCNAALRDKLCVIHLILRMSDAYLSLSLTWQVVCMSWELEWDAGSRTLAAVCDGPIPTFHECQILIIKNSGTFLSYLTFTCLKPKMSANVKLNCVCVFQNYIQTSSPVNQRLLKIKTWILDWSNPLLR